MLAAVTLASVVVTVTSNAGALDGEEQEIRLPGAATIVALGDSYSSGEANPPFTDETDRRTNRCHRSPKRSWPGMLGVTRDHHLACSGDVTSDLYAFDRNSADRNSAPDDVSQIERLRGFADAGDVSAVTVTIGGNDVDFAKILGKCYAVRCLRIPSKEKLHIDDVTEKRLIPTLESIRDASGGAPVFLVGYPRLFPTDHRATKRCGWLTPEERENALELQGYFEGRQQEAAARAGVGFVSVYDTLDGHELCTGDANSWFHPVSTRDCKLTLNQTTKRSCGHPLENGDRHGQRAIAKQVSSTLRSSMVRGIDLRNTTLPAGACAEGSPQIEVWGGRGDNGVPVSVGRWDAFIGDHIEHRDIDHNGTDEAVVVLHCYRDGTNTQLSSLWVYTANPGSHLVAVGNRITAITPTEGIWAPVISSFTVDGDAILVVEAVFRTNDAHCCPSREVTTRWVFDGAAWRPDAPPPLPALDPYSLSTDGIQPLSFGDSVQRAEDVTRALARRGCGGTGDTYISVPGLLLHFSNGVFDSYVVEGTGSDAYQTVSGVRVGMSLAELTNLIPYAQEEQTEFGNTVHVVRSGGGVLTFVVDGGRVTKLIGSLGEFVGC